MDWKLICGDDGHHFVVVMSSTPTYDSEEVNAIPVFICDCLNLDEVRCLTRQIRYSLISNMEFLSSLNSIAI